MRKRNVMMKKAIILTALAALSGGAFSQTWTMSWTGYGNGYDWLPFTISNGTSTEQNVYAGSVELSAASGTTDLSLEGYCTSPFVWVKSTWGADLSTNTGIADQVAQIAGVNVGGNQALGAAVQLAIWDAVTGSSFTWSTSSSYDATIRSYYNELVDGTYSGLSKDVPNYSLWKSDPTGYSQDMITINPGSHQPQSTPEPVSGAILAAGLGLAALRRRRCAR
jgi:MYXO-CTERM domain-containing protein